MVLGGRGGGSFGLVHRLIFIAVIIIIITMKALFKIRPPAKNTLNNLSF